MKKTVLLLAAAAALTGCGDHGDAKNAIKRLLNDPDSAKFSDLSDGKNKGDVCGLVNAKNRMGGYVGSTPFFYQKSTETAAIAKPPEDRDFRSLWLGIQANSFGDDLDKVMTQCRLMSQWDDVCKTPHPMPEHKMCEVVLGDITQIYEKLRQAYAR